MTTVMNGLVVRPATVGDALEVHRMFGRCSTDTRYGRFHGHVSAIPAGYLCEALTAAPCLHDALVLQRTAGPELVALGSARRVDGENAAVEIGLLVEDAAQGRGLGTLLLVTLAARARDRGVSVVTCDVLAAGEHLVGVLRRLLGPVETVREGCTVRARVRLR